MQGPAVSPLRGTGGEPQRIPDGPAEGACQTRRAGRPTFLAPQGPGRRLPERPMEGGRAALRGGSA